jgi:hypothetical protein
VRVRVIQTGRRVGNETVMRGRGRSSLIRRRKPYELPALCFILEHPEGPIAIDTGLSTRVRVRRGLRLLGAPDP